MNYSKIIWLYWETRQGTGKPGYIDLCLDSIRRHAPPGWEVIVTDPGNIRDFVPTACEKFVDVELPAHRADYLRSELLSLHGGMWCDSDVLAVDSLSYMSDLLKEHNDVFWGRSVNKPCIGAFACVKNSPLVTAWRDVVRGKVERGFVAGRWIELGAKSLWPLAGKIPYKHISHRTTAPIHWSKVSVLAKDLPVTRALCPETRAVSLFNQKLKKVMGGMSAEDIMSGNSLLKKLVDVSVRNSV